MSERVFGTADDPIAKAIVKAIVKAVVKAIVKARTRRLRQNAHEPPGICVGSLARTSCESGLRQVFDGFDGSRALARSVTRPDPLRLDDGMERWKVGDAKKAAVQPEAFFSGPGLFHVVANGLLYDFPAG